MKHVSRMIRSWLSIVRRMCEIGPYKVEGAVAKAARFVGCETKRLRNVRYGTVPTAEVTSDSYTIYEVI